MRTAWLPKTFTTLRGYTGRQLAADLQAGVVVGIVAIPLALPFAIASGVSPTAAEAARIATVRGVRQLARHRADKIKDVLHFVAKKPKVFILRMRNVPAVDASGIRVLDDLFRSFSHQGIRFVIAGIQAQPLVALDRAGKLDEYGRENFVATLDEALEMARSAAARGGNP